jgi:hypothetical protein
MAVAAVPWAVAIVMVPSPAMLTAALEPDPPIADPVIDRVLPDEPMLTPWALLPGPVPPVTFPWIVTFESPTMDKQRLVDAVPPVTFPLIVIVVPLTSKNPVLVPATRFIYNVRVTLLVNTVPAVGVVPLEAQARIRAQV